MSGPLLCGPLGEPSRRGWSIWIRACPPVFAPVVWLTAEQVTQQVLSLALFAVIAPLLGPHTYGVFAIVMIFVGVCESILLDGAARGL